MARDDLVPLTAGETPAEFAVEDAQLRGEPLGLRTAAELPSDPLGEEGVPGRIEPEVGVGHGRAEQVVGGCRRRVDRRLQRGLETSQVEDEVRVGDRADVAAGELEVVWLDAGRRQVCDADACAADLLGGEGQGIERRDDGGSAGVFRATAAPGEGRGGDESENDSRLHVRHPSTPMRIAIIFLDGRRPVLA